MQNNITPNNNNIYDINIKQLSYGYVVNIGCQSFAIENSETLIKVTHKSSGGYKYNIHRVIVPAMDKISKEVKKRGYEYFQIVSPKQISNLDGFPINNKEDLASFLNPQISMATHELNFLETNKTLMDNQNSQNVVNLPFTYFGTTKLELVIRMVKEPEYNEIVWNVNN
jgi:hypothetical protein